MADEYQFAGGTHYQDAATINAALKDYPGVKVTGTIYAEQPIKIPYDGMLYTPVKQMIVRSFDGDALIEVPDYGTLSGLKINSGGHSGIGIVVPGETNFQEFYRLQVTGFDKPCIYFDGDAAGAACLIEKCMAQRADPTSPAIVLPKDRGTRGLRKLVNCQGGGGLLLDTGGSNSTIINGCNSMGLLMGPETRYAKMHDCRIAVPEGRTLIINGYNSSIVENTIGGMVDFSGDAHGNGYRAGADGGVRLLPGATHNSIVMMPWANSVVDESGNDTNTLAMWTPI